MIALLALAAPSAKAATPVGQHAASMPSMFGAMFTLLLVLGLIIGLGWLLKRLPGGAFRPVEGVKVVASINVGAKERVVVVDVNGQQLLLGVTAGGISTLHALPEPLPQTPAPTLPDFKQLPNFAQLLSQKLRKGS
ncbi:flagellar biosynthetic protein FliO [Stenotrophomonas sp. SY1]|uniref:flagellar biosynthetic protein FliO n=1 Tax=Stenotrophomonas sp. SY1 TaxID=477235 RepID=UPI001E3CC6FF|nr:flagellar biosynthetic protein FliO [Stenotrophomonas sp. SY1]MCD9087164.1 flagellar biosynthetic protein FliO [Stenotrophomonas sp. SY1]